MVAALDERPLSSSTTSNWVARNGGLPPRVRGIVRKLMAKGLPESHAIALALHLVKTTRATGRVFGGKYAAHADTKAVHTKAASQWDALKTRAHAHTLAGQPALELAMLNAEIRAANAQVVDLGTYMADAGRRAGRTVAIALTAVVAKTTIPSKTVHAYLAKNYPERVLGWVDSATWTKRAVRLSDIKMSRRPGGRDDAKTSGIADAVKAGKPMDPVVLVDTGEGDGLEIADGYHRTLGFDRAGRATIEAYVATGCGEHGPWEKAMHDAKLNLAAIAAGALLLATPIGSTTDGPRQVVLAYGRTPAGRRALVKAHLRRRARALGALNPEGATK